MVLVFSPFVGGFLTSFVKFLAIGGRLQLVGGSRLLLGSSSVMGQGPSSAVYGNTVQLVWTTLPFAYCVLAS